MRCWLAALDVPGCAAESETEEIFIGQMPLKEFNKFSVKTRLKLSQNTVDNLLERINTPGSPPSVNEMNDFFNQWEKTHKSGQFSDEETKKVLDYLQKFRVQKLPAYSKNLETLKNRCGKYLGPASGKKNEENAEKIRSELNEIVNFPDQLSQAKQEVKKEVEKVAKKLKVISPELSNRFKELKRPGDSEEIQNLLQDMAKDLVSYQQKTPGNQQQTPSNGYGL